MHKMCRYNKWEEMVLMVVAWGLWIRQQWHCKDNICGGDNAIMEKSVTLQQ